jgi:hypothetical protein
LLGQFGSTKDPTVAERTGRSCLLLPVEKDELQQAATLAERAVAAGQAGHEFAYPYRLFAQGLGRYRKGQNEQSRETLAAAILSYDWSEAKADNHDAWIAHILRREAEAMSRLNEPTVPK